MSELRRIVAILLLVACSRALESAPPEPSAQRRAIVAEGAGWTEMPTLGRLWGAGLAAFDGGYVMFGGTDELEGSRDRTWVFDGNAWHGVQPQHSPSARTSPAMTTFRGRVLMFGGTNYLRETGTRVVQNDTWEWDGTDWTQRLTAPVPPGDGAQMIAVGQEVVLVASGETWVWDGSTWTQRLNSPAPSGGFSTLSAFDGGALLVVGSQAWLWTGSSWALSAATTPPTYWRPAACESTTGVVLVTPAMTGPTPSFRFTGASWTPTALLNASGPFEVACAGAEVLARSPTETLRYDGGSWATLSPTPVPPQADSHAMASFDGSVVLFTEQQTWTWNGAAWRRETPATSPPNRSYPAMAEVAGGVLLFGGSASFDTWLWDGVTWRELMPPHRPDPVSFPVMASWRGNALLFDSTHARTWLWDGGTWAEVALDASIPPLPFARVAPFDGGVLLFGGGVAQNETWFFDGNTWTRLMPATTPPGRSWHAMANLEGRVVMFGGSNSVVRGDTWVWDGTDWTEWIGPGPLARAKPALAPAGEHLVLFAGAAPWNTPLRDTWHFRFRGTLGSTCTTAASCESGFCVDGVCCDAACGGGTSDCQACSVIAGAAANGRCVLLSFATLCRTANGACDLAERCSGSSASCPADGVADGGWVCRAATGVCDRPETCDGLATTCPPDRLEAAGVACRAAACSSGLSTAGASCSGTLADCPAPTSASCGLFACGPTACLTNCADEGECASGFVCEAGGCTRPLPDGTSCDRSTQCQSQRCSAGVCCPRDGGCVVLDAGEVTDAGAEDAGTQAVDGGAEPADAGALAGRDAGADQPARTTACGCTTTDGAFSGVLLLGLLAAARRRNERY